MQQTHAKGVQDLIRRMNHWELCKRLEYNHLVKCYMLKSESLLENETRKTLRDFKLQTDLVNPARGPDLVFINQKKSLSSRVFCNNNNNN